MRSLYFGGSFNPIHHGHLICARAVAELHGFDRIVLIPAGHPPHKPDDPELAAPSDRLEMCRLAAHGTGLFAVDDLEIRRSGSAYTIDTVRELKRRGEPNVAWLIGADMVLFLPHWHEPAALLREADLIPIGRPGWELNARSLPQEFQPLLDRVVPAPWIDIRASEIRQRVVAGLDIRFLTPGPVCRYIHERGLYRTPCRSTPTTSPTAPA